tara:strand:+ start:2690 stop:4636 length:1947 start_codon:yes stop_codon:yes gene_type:complete
MAIKLSNTGITSGSVVKSAEVSQSVDAFTGTIAYDIQQSGSFNQTGSTILSGSVYLPDNTHMGIGAIPSPTAGVKLLLSANDSTNDPVVLIEAFGVADSATIGWKNPDVRWNLGLAGGSGDAFVLQNQTTNKFPILVDYSSSNASLVFRNDNGSDLFQKVGINWPYGEMVVTNPNHTLLVSGSITASDGYYGDLIGTASNSDKLKVTQIISNTTMPILVMPGVVDNGYKDIMANDTYLNWNAVTRIIEATASWATASVSASYSETASYALTAESSNPLWYDGTSFITSSVKVSASRFIGDITGSEASMVDVIANNILASTYFSGSSYTASNATQEITIGPNNVAYNFNGSSFLQNRNVGTNATLNIGVGGIGGTTSTGLIINNHNESSIGSSTPTFSYPLGYSAGEIHSYIQMQNNHQNSASVLAVKGANGSDGIVYLGGNEAYGGGILYHGGAGLTRVPTTFTNGNTSLYRSSASVPYPIMDYPTDNNHIMVRLDKSPTNLNNLDYFGIGPVGSSFQPYIRTYMLQGFLTSGQGNSIALGEVGAVGSGTYQVKLTVGKSNNQSPITEAAVVTLTSTYFVDQFGNQPQALINGTTPTVTNIEGSVGSMSVTIAIVTISTGFQFRASGKVSSATNLNGFAEITFFPNNI